VTFIGTNNEAGAKLAGDYMCKNLKPGDKVAILQGLITQSTGKARADGSKAGLSACGLNIVAQTPAEWDTAKAQAAMEDILTKNPDLKGVFASNDNMALGAVQAIKNAKLTGKIMVVGFDANPDAATAILAGDMNASVAQAPSNMGKFGVESLLKLVQGGTIEANIDTGTELVTKTMPLSMCSPEPAGCRSSLRTLDLVNMGFQAQPLWPPEKGALDVASARRK
jgi:ribose transport system substrate-binding protein